MDNDFAGNTNTTTNIGSGISAGTIQSPSGDDWQASTGGVSANAAAPGRIPGKEAGLLSANAAVQVQIDVTTADTGSDAAIPMIVAQATPGAALIQAAAAAAGGKVVGTIQIVIGDVKLIGVDGVARAAHVGDKVYVKETLATGVDGIVQVQLENGHSLDFGRDSKIALDPAIPNEGDAGGAFTATTPPPQEVAALQVAIAAGQNPMQVAEPTAAGSASGVDGADSGGILVIIEQANSSGAVTSGYSTAGDSIAFFTPEFQLLPTTQSLPEITVRAGSTGPFGSDALGTVHDAGLQSDGASKIVGLNIDGNVFRGGAAITDPDGSFANEVSNFTYELQHAVTGVNLDYGTDTITNFGPASAGSSGDIIDISAVLDLAGNAWVDGGSYTDATTGAYLTFANDGSGNTQVKVDIDGSAGVAFAPTTVAVLQGVDPTLAITLLSDNTKRD